jgi:hypothetical protein
VAEWRKTSGGEVISTTYGNYWVKSKYTPLKSGDSGDSSRSTKASITTITAYTTITTITDKEDPHTVQGSFEESDPSFSIEEIF